MLLASDELEESDTERSQKLLVEVLRLNEWLIGADPKQEMKVVHFINRMQIVKRQRDLSEEEKKELESMLVNVEMEKPLKIGVLLLLDRQKEAKEIFEFLSEEDKKTMREYPIWRFAK